MLQNSLYFYVTSIWITGFDTLMYVDITKKKKKKRQNGARPSTRKLGGLKYLDTLLISLKSMGNIIFGSWWFRQNPGLCVSLSPLRYRHLLFTSLNPISLIPPLHHILMPPIFPLPPYTDTSIHSTVTIYWNLYSR